MLIGISFNITFPFGSSEFGKLYNTVPKELAFYCLACSFSSGPVACWSFVPLMLMGCITWITQLPSGTAAVFEEGFSPHSLLTMTTPFLWVFQPPPQPPILSAERILRGGWCNTFLTGIHCLLNVAVKVLRTRNFFFLPIKLARDLYLAHCLPKKSIF